MAQPFNWKQFFFGKWYRTLITIVITIALVAMFSFFVIMILFIGFVIKLVATSLLNIASGGNRCKCK